MRRFLEKALTGDLRALALLIKLDGAGAAADDATTGTNPDLAPAETALLCEYLAKLGSEGA